MKYVYVILSGMYTSIAIDLVTEHHMGSSRLPLVDAKGRSTNFFLAFRKNTGNWTHLEKINQRNTLMDPDSISSLSPCDIGSQQVILCILFWREFSEGMKENGSLGLSFFICEIEWSQCHFRLLTQCFGLYLHTVRAQHTWTIIVFKKYTLPHCQNQ